MPSFALSQQLCFGNERPIMAQERVREKKIRTDSRWHGARTTGACRTGRRSQMRSRGATRAAAASRVIAVLAGQILQQFITFVLWTTYRQIVLPARLNWTPVKWECPVCPKLLHPQEEKRACLELSRTGYNYYADITRQEFWKGCY